MTISKSGGIIKANVVLLTAPTSEMKSPKNGIASAKITEKIKMNYSKYFLWFKHIEDRKYNLSSLIFQQINSRKTTNTPQKSSITRNVSTVI